LRRLHIGFGSLPAPVISIGASRDPGGAIGPLASAEVGPVDQDLSRAKVLPGLSQGVRSTGAGQSWRDVGLCRDKDPNLFYPLGKGRGTVQQAEVAKAFCLVCPSREPCLAFALAFDAEFLLVPTMEVDMASTMFAFAVSRALSTAVVTLHGEVDQRSVDRLTFILRGVIDDQRNQTVVVDMRDVSGVDPSAVTLFQDATGWARHRGADFYLQSYFPSGRGHGGRPPAATTSSL
jgi:ABC-type transporter Mla MlaB component